ncbi:MAG: hypothetical protein ACTSVV_12745, partial [Promethearchaeota archaeon]
LNDNLQEFPQAIENEPSNNRKSQVQVLNESYFDILLYKPTLKEIRNKNVFNRIELNTELRIIKIKKENFIISDIFLYQEFYKKIKKKKSKTNLNPISNHEISIQSPDIILSHEREKFSSISQINTKLSQIKFKDKSNEDSINSNLNLQLRPNLKIKQITDLKTELNTVEIQRGLENIISGKQAEVPIFERFINCDNKLPRGFSESFNSPIIILIGEDECEWHLPIIFTLRELYREIMERFPLITFRESQSFETNIEDFVDSLEPHSLEHFTFQNKIEFIDARKRYYPIKEFIEIVKERLKSGFLQQFGILIIAIKSRDLQKLKNSLNIFRGLKIFSCKPNDERYENFCSKIFGMNISKDFFNNLERYEYYLKSTFKNFSVFVKMGKNSSDKYQYSLKVATFVYLLNDYYSREKQEKKKIINNIENLIDFIKKIQEKKIIEVEKALKDNSSSNESIIPDIIYKINNDKIIYIEIETLIGTLEPLKKIDKTIEKYEKISENINYSIWIVLKPISAILHYEELKLREKIYKHLYSDKKIKFKVLTLSISKNKFKWNLINLDKFLSEWNVKQFTK